MAEIELAKLVIRLEAETAGTINLDIMLNRISISDRTTSDERRPGRRVSAAGWPACNADSIHTVDAKTILMRGHDAEVEFAAGVRVVCDGELTNPSSQLLARNCSEVVMYVASSTSNRVDEPASEVQKRLTAAEKTGISALREEHVNDFSRLMGRCTLDLGAAPGGPTDDRIAAVRSGATDNPRKRGPPRTRLA